VKLIGKVPFVFLISTVSNFGLALEEQTEGVSGKYNQNNQPTKTDRLLEMKPVSDFILTRVWDDSYHLGYEIADFFCKKHYLDCREHWDKEKK